MRVYYYVNRLIGDCGVHTYHRECLYLDMDEPPNFNKDDTADRKALLESLRRSRATCECGRLQIVVQLGEVET